MGKGENKLNFMMAALFIFQTFPPLFLGLCDSGDFCWDAFFQNSVALQIRLGADVSVSVLHFFVYSKFVSSVMLTLLIVGVVDCVMDAKV
jgi:hypothetical protein